MLPIELRQLTTTTVLWQLYRTTYISRQFHSRTGRFVGATARMLLLMAISAFRWGRRR